MLKFKSDQTLNYSLQKFDKENIKTYEMKNDPLFVLKKYDQIHMLLFKLPSKLDKESFAEIRNIASSRGGFIKNTYRKILWKRITEYNLSKNPRKNFIPQVKQEEELSRIIHLDVKRTCLNEMKNFKDQENLKANLINKLEHLLKNIFLNQTCYSYYQGFHEVCLYPMLIYSENEKDLQLIVKGLIEHHFNDEVCLGAEISSNIFSILLKTIEIVDDEFHSDEALVDFSCACVCHVLTWFGNKVTDAGIGLRIFDYLLCSPPFAIYVLVACFIVETYRKFKSSQEQDFHLYYQKINYDEIDYDDLIEKCESIYISKRRKISQLLRSFTGSFVKDSSKLKDKLPPYVLPKTYKIIFQVVTVLTMILVVYYFYLKMNYMI